MTDDVRLWGDEVGLDRFIQMCKNGEVAYVEWFIEPDRLRINTKAGGRFNYRNAETKLDIPKVMQAQGIEIGDHGIPIEFEN